MPKIKEKFITNEKGQKEAVVLDFKTYEELVEDLEDLYLIAERKNEPSLSLEDIKRSLKRSGLI